MHWVICFNTFPLIKHFLYAGSFWYLIRSNESKDTNLGYWRTKVEACEIFSNSILTGWRATLEFYEGQAPHERKTNWVMQEYWITQKKVSENSKKKVINGGLPALCDLFSWCVLFILFSTQPASHLPVWLDNVQDASLLCRVQSVSGEPKSNCKNLEKMFASDRASHSTQPVVPLADNRTGHASTSKPQVDILVMYYVLQGSYLYVKYVFVWLSWEAVYFLYKFNFVPMWAGEGSLYVC